MEKEIRYLNENEVSFITGLSVQTLRNWRFLGKGIPFTKAERAVRYRFDDIVSFMEARKVDPQKCKEG